MKNKKGFTLIELLVVIGIIGIIATIAIPSMKEIILNYKLKNAATKIYSDLQRAKMEAIRQNTNVIMTFTTGNYTSEGGVGSYVVSYDNDDDNKVIVSSDSMPKTVSLFDDKNECTFIGHTAGFNGQGLPIKLGSVQVRNSTRRYRIRVTIAGNIELGISSNDKDFI